MQNQELLQKTVDYLEGRYPAKEYISEIYEKNDLYIWLQSLVPAGKMTTIYVPYEGAYLDPETDTVMYDQKPMKIPYDIFDDLVRHERRDFGGPKWSVGYIHYTHQLLLELFFQAFPTCGIEPTEEYAVKNEFRFVCPDYIDGIEVIDQGVLDKIIDSLPKDLSMSKKKTLFRKLVREAFHVEGNKFPYWIQSPEWPVNNGIPLKFVKSKKINAEMKHHYFVDTVTGEERIVEDFY